VPGTSAKNSALPPTEQRLTYITALLRELGFPPARARRRALLAYSAYLGQLQLMRSAPGLLPKPGAARTAYADDILATLLAEGATSGPVRSPSG
jgi:hypothetical protein